MRIGLVTNWARQCGIAEYSRYLADALAEARVEVAVLARDNPATASASAPQGALTVCPCWSSTDLSGVLSAADDLRLDLLHFQHEFSFFPTDQLCGLVRQATGRGLRCVATLHSVARYRAATARLGMLADALIIHAEEHRPDLPDHDLYASRIAVIPQGTPLFPRACRSEVRREMGIRSRCVLATFGFLRSYKGLEDVLDAVSLVARDIEDVTWLVFSSLHDDTAEGLRVYWELRRRAASLGLLRHLRIYTEFLPLPELGRLLQAADIIVLYYRPVPHITASSGAGRAALATGRPVVVADMSYFADLGEEVVKVEPEDPRLLGSTLLNLWSDPARRAALARRAEAKSADTAWPVVAHAHRALYERVIADSVVPELLASAALRQ